MKNKGDKLEIENVGRLPLVFQSIEQTRVMLGAGDVFSLGNRIVFLVVRRQPVWPALRFAKGAPLHPFGQPDAMGFVGESLAAWTIRDQIAFVAKRDQHTLLLGESGVGKELVATGIHAHSRRAKARLVSRNAATIPDTLFDAELFGNAPNYPNPGMADRAGLVGEAHQSTLFLDEIGELPETLQNHLLRFLDNKGEYHRLGESKARTSNVRLVAATNRPVEALKDDFLARFMLRLQVPALEVRKEDIPLLVRHLMMRIAQTDPDLCELFFEEESGEARVSPELLEALLLHTWSLNVRELEALLWMSMSTSKDNWLRVTPQLKAELRLPAPLPEITEARIRAALIKHNGRQAKAWKELGLKNRYVLRRLIKKFNISLNDDDDKS